MELGLICLKIEIMFDKFYVIKELNKVLNEVGEGANLFLRKLWCVVEESVEFI